MSLSLAYLSAASTYIFFVFPNLPSLIFDVLCVFMPAAGYIDQMRLMIKNKTSANFKMHSSQVLLLSNFLRIVYWIGQRFELYLLWQSIAMISIHITLAFLYFFYQDRTPKQAVSLPDGLQRFYRTRKPSFSGFRPFSAESFSEFAFSLGLIYLAIFLAYAVAAFFFDPQVISSIIGLSSNGIDSLVTLPHFVSIVLQKDIKFTTPMLIAQWNLAVVFKAVLFFCRPVPWTFRLGTGVQAGLTLAMTVSYFQIQKSTKPSENELEKAAESQKLLPDTYVK